MEWFLIALVSNNKKSKFLNFSSLQLFMKCVQSTAVGQAVACAPVTQRARVRSQVGTSFLGEVFSSPVRQISGSVKPPRSPNIIFPSLSSFITGANDLRCWRALKPQIYIQECFRGRLGVQTKCHTNILCGWEHEIGQFKDRNDQSLWIYCNVKYTGHTTRFHNFNLDVNKPSRTGQHMMC